MKKWEYKTIKVHTTGWIIGGEIDERRLDDHMSRLGADGWEMVLTTHTTQMLGASRAVLVMFKREIELGD